MLRDNDSDWEQRLSSIEQRETQDERGHGVQQWARKRFKTQIKRFLDETQWFSDYLGLPLTFTFLHKVSLLLFHLRYSARHRSVKIFHARNIKPRQDFRL